MLPLLQRETKLAAGHTGGGLYPRQGGGGGGPGTTRGLLCSSLGPFGRGAPPSGPALALPCAQGASWLAFLWPQLPHLWQVPAAVSSLVPVVSGLQVAHSARFCEDLPGLSGQVPCPWSLLLGPTNEDGWSSRLQGRFCIHRLPAQSSPQGPPCPISLPLTVGCLPLFSSLSPLCRGL